MKKKIKKKGVGEMEIHVLLYCLRYSLEVYLEMLPISIFRHSSNEYPQCMLCLKLKKNSKLKTPVTYQQILGPSV